MVLKVHKRAVARALIGVLAAMAAAAALAQDPAAPTVGHLALIIGNSDYNLDGAIDGVGAILTPGMLKDLKNPCADAVLFKQKLIAANWTADEIIDPKCNLTADEMRGYITQFRQRLANSHNTVGIFYYSGHGAQFASGETAHSFLFGAGAKFDLKQLADSLKTAPDNTSFAATSAIDLHELVGALGQQSDNALLVVLDACRDNPLYADLRDIENAPAIEALSSNSDEFKGVVIAYATPAGMFAGDGFGPSSIFTGAFVDLLKPPRRLDSVLNKLRGNVVKATRAQYPNRKTIQEPAIKGRFVADWCVWRCAPEIEPAPVALLEPAKTRHLAANPLLLRIGLLAPQAAAPTPPPTEAHPANKSVGLPRTVYQSELDGAPIDPQGLRFDVFWCSGDAGDELRQAYANQVAQDIGFDALSQASDRPTAAGASRRNIRVSSVRVRELSAEANTFIGYRYSGDYAIYDAGDGNELLWAKYASRVSQYRISPRAETEKTPGYVSVFVCGLDLKSSSTQIYLQIPPKIAKSTGQAVLDAISTDARTINHGIEVRDEGPDRTEIRFYHLEDRDNVFMVAKALERILGEDVIVRFLSRYTASTSSGRMEVWLGQDLEPDDLTEKLQVALARRSNP
jgi:hypothetical protein